MWKSKLTFHYIVISVIDRSVVYFFTSLVPFKHSTTMSLGIAFDNLHSLAMYIPSLAPMGFTITYHIALVRMGPPILRVRRGGGHPGSVLYEGPL